MLYKYNWTFRRFSMIQNVQKISKTLVFETSDNQIPWIDFPDVVEYVC